jgi:VanZ family protein
MVTPSVPPPEPGASRGRAAILFALLALLLMGAIFWLSSGPVPPVVPDQFLDLLVKKAGHFSGYALLAALWWLVLRGRVPPRVALVAAFAIAAGYAGSDEIHQVFSPSRDPSVLDVGIDALGAATGLWVVARRAPTRHERPDPGQA